MGDDLTRRIREALLADASPARRRDALAALNDVIALCDRCDRLEAAARPDDELSKRAVAVVDAVRALDPHVTQMMPTSVIVAVADLAAALPSPPKPLAVGDTPAGSSPNIPTPTPLDDAAATRHMLPHLDLDELAELRSLMDEAGWRSEDRLERDFASTLRDREVIAGLLAALHRFVPDARPALAVGDTVTREDADRVPVGAILRDPDGDAWQVVEPDEGREPEWWLVGSRVPNAPATIINDCWPMTVLWLPEPSEGGES